MFDFQRKGKKPMNDSVFLPPECIIDELELSGDKELLISGDGIYRLAKNISEIFGCKIQGFDYGVEAENAAGGNSFSLKAGVPGASSCRGIDTAILFDMSLKRPEAFRETLGALYKNLTENAKILFVFGRAKGAARLKIFSEITGKSKAGAGNCVVDYILLLNHAGFSFIGNWTNYSVLRPVIYGNNPKESSASKRFADRALGLFFPAQFCVLAEKFTHSLKKERNLHEELYEFRWVKNPEILREYHKTPMQIYSNAYMKELERLLEKKLFKGCGVLDAGCGPSFGGERFGNLIEKHADVGFHGVDISAKTVRDLEPLTQKRANMEVKVSSAYEIDYPDNHFDIVVFTDVIEHISNPFLALKEVKRVMKPDGLLILGQPNGAPHLCVRTLFKALDALFAARSGFLNPEGDLPLGDVRDIEKKTGRHEHLKEYSYGGLTRLAELNGLAIRRRLGGNITPPAFLGNAYNTSATARAATWVFDKMFFHASCKGNLTFICRKA